MKNVIGVIACLLMSMPAVLLAQPAPPAPGVQLPQGYYDQIADNPRAFQFDHAWIKKADMARKARKAFLDRPENRGMSMASLPASLRATMVVDGTVKVPVIMIKYANTPADPSTPVSVAEMDDLLFSNNPTGSMTDLYDEMSGGLLNLTGDVLGWIIGSSNDTFYEGAAGCNGICGSAQTGQLIAQALNGVDGSVDFGDYDNDGPDGVANSGDDDGFVDFIAIVHPESGGECGGTNMWSHRWVVGGWPNFGSQPWSSNDPRSGGGNIRVWDYTIQPALGGTTGCSSASINSIGVYAHEFGHAFGIPDLYDTDGGGQGIGEHGLMGSGNWQDPPNPSHMSAWSKAQLGWANITEVDYNLQSYNIPSVVTTNTVFQLNIFEEPFRRKSGGALNGAFSMHCGLNGIEAAARNWQGGQGYGDNWDEGIRRDFSYNGSNPVNLTYTVAYDTEATYDFCYVRITVNGTESTLRTYDGVGGETRNIDITSYLNGMGASTYQISFEFTSDFAASDVDGIHNSVAGMRIDDVSVVGGGENHTADFEADEGGWYYDFTENPHKEYYLVENRNKNGAQFDQFAHANGLIIYHIEDNVGGDNSGGTSGTSNLQPATVEVECADGNNQLLTGANRGDSADDWINNNTFDNASNPNSLSHNNLATNVQVSGMSGPGPTMTANMRAGRDAPTISSVTPNNSESGMLVAITLINGNNMAHGSTFVLRSPATAVSEPQSSAALPDFSAQSVDWIGKRKMAGVIDLNGVPAGTYDFVVIGPDGQEAVLASGFTISPPSPVLIQTFGAKIVASGIELSWDIYADEPMSGFRVMRSDAGTNNARIVSGGTLLATDQRSFVDTTVEPGRRYDYALQVLLPSGTILSSQSATVSAPTPSLALFQNYPNPFNPSTRIKYQMPESGQVTLIVYDPQGRRVRTLISGVQPAGPGEAVWDGRSDSGGPVASGVYFYRLSAGKNVLTRKMLLLK